jgi:hypothetical protein
VKCEIRVAAVVEPDFGFELDMMTPTMCSMKCLQGNFLPLFFLDLTTFLDLGVVDLFFNGTAGSQVVKMESGCNYGEHGSCMNMVVTIWYFVFSKDIK